jgi:hypothetical protein
MADQPLGAPALDEVRGQDMTRLGIVGGNSKRIAAIQRRVDEILAAAPELTSAQVDRLRAIFADGVQAIEKSGEQAHAARSAADLSNAGPAPAVGPPIGLGPGGTVWRTGRKVGRTIYAQQAPEPSDGDPLIGVMDTPELATEAVEARNRLAGGRAQVGSMLAGARKRLADDLRADDPGEILRRVTREVGEVYTRGRLDGMAAAAAKVGSLERLVDQLRAAAAADGEAGHG